MPKEARESVNCLRGAEKYQMPGRGGGEGRVSATV